ncbi:DUF1525 domain-containing protein [Thiomicrorhabdus indica]|uniref:DUF1525 domain-containing protein n=1 Tax=Thiomicrorhabdus indica TaxID=2267253 RepID=UPI0013EE8988|nr:DUF1525 domain-containing protein [Thiomicrorhabdus indica]
MQRNVLGVFGLSMCLGMFGAAFSTQVAGAVLENVHTIELFVSAKTKVVELEQNQYPKIKQVIYVVDGLDVIEYQLNQKLKNVNNEIDAQKLMQPYFANQDFVTSLQKAHLAKVRAKHFKLKRLPAAVINGEQIHYGMTDLNVLMQSIEDNQ